MRRGRGGASREGRGRKPLHVLIQYFIKLGLTYWLIETVYVASDTNNVRTANVHCGYFADDVGRDSSPNGRG